jgi:hypothetical protein
MVLIGYSVLIRVSSQWETLDCTPMIGQKRLGGVGGVDH